MPRRGDGRICRGGTMQVKAEILADHLLVEDLLQQAAIARAKLDRVMRQVFIPAVGAEIPDKDAMENRVRASLRAVHRLRGMPASNLS